MRKLSRNSSSFCLDSTLAALCNWYLFIFSGGTESFDVFSSRNVRIPDNNESKSFNCEGIGLDGRWESRSPNSKCTNKFLQIFCFIFRELTYCEGRLASIERRGRHAHDDHAVRLSVDRFGQKITEEGWKSPLLHPRTCLLSIWELSRIFAFSTLNISSYIHSITYR